MKDFEIGFYRFLEMERPDVLRTLGETRTLTDEVASGLDEAVDTFRQSFLA